MTIRAGNILVIDDEENLRKTLARILINAGWDVTGASNGADAIKLASRNSFDLVYLDLRLPDMHGIDILKELRNIDPNLPVVLLTAYGTMNTAVESMHLGATDYLLKPIEPDALIKRTKSIIDQRYRDKRKREIQEQIAVLQSELANLVSDVIPEANPPSLERDHNRYIYREPFIIDLQTRTVSLHNQALNLPPSTYEYFVVLARHAPEIVKYQTLINEALGYQAEYGEARELSKWHIHVLRQAIESDPRKPRYLLNARGLGYQLNID